MGKYYDKPQNVEDQPQQRDAATLSKVSGGTGDEISHAAVRLVAQHAERVLPPFVTNAAGELWRSICQCKLNDAQNRGSHVEDNIVTH
jgi:hypothetical protein